MRIHHLNCGSWHPRGGRLVNGGGEVPARMVCHCLLVETNQGLVLVDSGFGLEDVTRPERMHRLLRFLGRPALDPEETAARQVVRLGFGVEDVRHIVLTHLDLDHAGGLPDFPAATVHVLADEHLAAMERRTALERRRYQPRQWAHQPKWQTYRVEGERWMGFECVRALAGLSDDFLLVPLAGHTRGHAAVVLRNDDRWLLHAGDAYFHHAEMDAEHPSCTFGLSLFQRVAQIDGRQRRANQERLRLLAREQAGRVRVLCAHDPVEFDAQVAPC